MAQGSKMKYVNPTRIVYAVYTHDKYLYKTFPTEDLAIQCAKNLKPKFCPVVKPLLQVNLGGEWIQFRSKVRESEHDYFVRPSDPFYSTKKISEAISEDIKEPFKLDL